MPVRVEALAEDRCRFEPGSDSPAMLALYLGFLDADFEVVDGPELVEALRGGRPLPARRGRVDDTGRELSPVRPGRAGTGRR